MQGAVIPAKSGFLARGANMIGLLMDALCRTHPYTCPILAGAGLSTSLGFAVVDWSQLTGQATAALALAGLVGGSLVGAVVYAVNKYDQIRIAREKLYDDHNKQSLAAQLERLTEQARIASEESLANQTRLRESVHVLRNDAQVSHLENASLREDLEVLRKQFMEVSSQLRETDRLLTAAHAEMRRMTDLLATTESDRNALRTELEMIRKTQVSQGARIGSLEKTGTSAGSSDAIPALDRNTVAVNKATKAIEEAGN